MIPTGFIVFSLVLLNLLLIAVDLYFFVEFKKYIQKKSKRTKLIITSYAILTVLVTLSLIATVVIKWTSPREGILFTIAYFVFSLWYIPKIILFAPSIIIQAFKRISLRFKRRNEQQTFSEKRRKALATLGWISASIPYFAVAHETFVTTINPKIKYVEIPSPRIEFPLNELSFVQISDIHAGSLHNSELFDEIVYEINALKPDFVFITGDFVNFSVQELEIIENGLSRINPQVAKMACLGNHEHYMSSDELELFKSKIRQCGVDLLINENRTFDFYSTKLQIAGMDNTSHRMNYGDVGKALANLDERRFTILLSHDPSNWDKSVRRMTFVDLMLSGHTHGGQIAIELGDTLLSPASFMYKQYAGLYSDNFQHLYVNTGIGTMAFPLRIGLPPEITFIKLKPVSNQFYSNV